MKKIQKHFQNVMLVGMASKNSKKYAYKCVDRTRHNSIKGAKAKYVSHGTLDYVVSCANRHTLVFILFADLTCHSYQYNNLKMFLFLVHI